MSEDAGGRYHNHVDGVAVPSRSLRAQGRRGDHLRRAVTVTKDGEAATVYADDRLTTVVASPTTDEDGRYSFYVGEGTFEVTVADTDTATSPMPVEWRAAAAPPGGGGVASLADLEDVDLTGAAEGDVLTIDAEGLVVPSPSGTSDALLALATYDPASAGTDDFTDSTPAAFQGASLAVSFTAPADGTVEYELEAVCRSGNAATNLMWCLLESDGTTVVASAGFKFVTAATTVTRRRATFRETGLTPGASYTRKWGIASSNDVNIVTIYRGKGTAVDGYGAAIMKVFRRAV